MRRDKTKWRIPRFPLQNITVRCPNFTILLNQTTTNRSTPYVSAAYLDRLQTPQQRSQQSQFRSRCSSAATLAIASLADIGDLGIELFMKALVRIEWIDNGTVKAAPSHNRFRIRRTASVEWCRAMPASKTEWMRDCLVHKVSTNFILEPIRYQDLTPTRTDTGIWLQSLKRAQCTFYSRNHFKLSEETFYTMHKYVRIFPYSIVNENNNDFDSQKYQLPNVPDQPKILA